MKKQLLLILPILTLISATPIMAQVTPTPNTKSQERQQAAKDIREEIDTVRDNFRAKLAGIKDAKKKAQVERLDQQMAQVNTNRTSIMLRQLGNIEGVLNRLELRAAQAKTNGKDITAVTAAIVSARTFIATSKDKVAIQAAKSYVITITTESSLGSAVSKVRLQLSADLQLAHQSVLSARKAVVSVLQALAKVTGEKIAPLSPTPTIVN